MNIWVAAELDIAVPGGPLEHLVGLWNTMASRGHQVLISVPPPSGPAAREISFAVDVSVSGLGPRQFAFQCALWHQWHARTAQGIRPDCIFLRAGQWLLAPAIFGQKYNIPVIVEINGLARKHLASRQLFPQCISTAALIEGKLSRCARFVIAISPSVGKALILDHGLDEQRLVFIPTGVNCAEFRPSSSLEERMHDRRRFGLEKEIVIGYVGTFDWWQGLPNLLHALHHLRATHRGGNWKALIAGFGADEHSLRLLTMQLGLQDSVVFTGRLKSDDVPGFLRAIDIGVLPRDDYAPTPTKLLQYFASGLPAVYPALDDLLWLGEAGLTFVPGTRHATQGGLADVLAKLCDHAALREQVGARNRELSLRELDWTCIANKVEAVLIESSACHATGGLNNEAADRKT